MQIKTRIYDRKEEIIMKAVNIKWDVTDGTEDMTKEDMNEVLSTLPTEVEIPDNLIDNNEDFDEDYYSEYKLRELNNKFYNEYGNTLFPDLKPNYSNTNLQLLDKWNQDTPTENDPVQSYINRIKNQKDDDYGWLEPDGTYHPVEWANHFKWAQEYLDEHYPYKDNAHIYWRKDENGKRKHIVGGDCLVYHFH